MTHRHTHLDPVGGIAGDMFVAACLDVHPEWHGPVERNIRAAGLPTSWQVEITRGISSAVAGTRLAIRSPRHPGADHGHAHDHRPGDQGHHPGDQGHRHDDDPTGAHRDIRARLLAADIDDAVRDRAIDIFARLARAEATVHGVDPDDVHFHEIADWDSVADIVAAAWCIEAMGPGDWSIGPLPLGSGTVRTAHGVLPVPTPATAILLLGRPTVDDGIAGERVTPTGAAIVAHLDPGTGPRPAGTITATGHGLGTRSLPDRANLLRLLVFDTTDGTDPDARPVRPWTTTAVTVVEFEVDDQSPEDLAAGLDAVRSTAGVLDVVQQPVFAKKGRMATAVRVLVGSSARDGAIAACFSQTTTIGLRWREMTRAELPRTAVVRHGIDGKEVRRPSGAITAKPELDSIVTVAATQTERTAQRAAFDSPTATTDEDDS